MRVEILRKLSDVLFTKKFYLKKRKELVEQKFKNQIAVRADISRIEVRIRENSWEKIRFSPSLSVDRISSPPRQMEGFFSMFRT